MRLLASLSVLALIPAMASAQDKAETLPKLPFTSIQPEMFGMVGSLSNAWGDFDNDGDLDLAVSMKSGEVRLYRNDDGVFVSIGSAMGLPTSGKEFRGLSWGDYDGDGWLDLHGGATSPKEISVVFHNEGGKGFREVAEEVGLTLPGRSARQSSWIDYDNDGDLDFYGTDRIGVNRLYRNDDGKFVQAFADNGITDPRPTVGACWFDYNGDGKLDLFLANQSGATDALWRNDGNGFTDVAAEAGVASPGRSKQEGGVGCAIGDYDNDGLLDIFVPNYGVNALFRNNGNGTFTNVAEEVGLAFDNHAVGAAWGDYDNDGFIDLSIMSYEGPSGQQVPKNRLLRNVGGKKFVNVLADDSPMNAGDHSTQWVDYNKDGALDLSITDGYGPEGGHFLFRNMMAAATAKRSLAVQVTDAKGHFTRYGAEVRIKDSKGKILGTRLISAGDGYNTQSALPAYFGLTKMQRVTVEVTFMSNDGRKVQTIRNVNPADYAGKALIVKEDATH
ncbi:MAG: CRTAC1 family protein [Sphingobium sp.]|nr:CRTAC1 family protein [Sphingobium sp.]